MSDGQSDAAFEWLCEAVADPGNELSFGAFGAIGSFRPDRPPDLRTDRHGMVAETAAATLRVVRHPAFRPFAFEILSSDPARWNHGVALCLPAKDALMSGHAALTYLGPDRDAIHAADRDLGLFDLGLGASYADLCVRAREKAALDRLMARSGAPIAFPSDEPLFTNLDWIFITALGRLELRSAASCFVIPSLIAGGRSHAVTTPVPMGVTPCGYLFPPNPSRSRPGEAFDIAAHDRFQAVFRRFGPPDHVALKTAIERALDRGAGPESIDMPASRHARAVLRVALRQRRRLDPAQNLDAWLMAFDRPAAGLAGAAS